MTRLWPQGHLIAVFTALSEEPERFTWLGQSHAVEEIVGKWRIDLDWWRERVWRDYFKLTTGSGLLVVIYRDLQADRWYLQRLYD
jgi:hypothetical protein